MEYIQTIDSLLDSIFSCCGVTAYLSTIVTNCFGRQKLKEEIDVDKNGDVKINVAI